MNSPFTCLVADRYSVLKSLKLTQLYHLVPGRLYLKALFLLDLPVTLSSDYFGSNPEWSTMAAPNERYYSSSGSGKKPYVSHGLPFQEACRHHAETTFGATRIYVVVSSSISKTQAFSDLQKALGSRLTGVRYGMAPHTPVRSSWYQWSWIVSFHLLCWLWLF